MTVLERLKAAGYDPAVSLFPDSIGNAGSMECERVQIRTFFCRSTRHTITRIQKWADHTLNPHVCQYPMQFLNLTFVCPIESI